MSAQSENHTLDDFCTDETVCASCGVDDDPEVSVPSDSPIGRCLDLDDDGEVCSECFQQHSTVYRVGGDSV